MLAKSHHHMSSIEAIAFYLANRAEIDAHLVAEASEFDSMP